MVLTAALELSKPLPLTPRFVMPRLHYRDVVSFEFAALDFAAPRANQFAFKLEGFDRDWEYAGTRRTVTYTNLPDGHYTLRVRAANPDGVWSETGLGLPLDVDPPPWLSGWAYFGYALVFAAIVVLCWEGHRRALLREARYSRRLKEEVTTRTRELAARNYGARAGQWPPRAGECDGPAHRPGQSARAHQRDAEIADAVGRRTPEGRREPRA